MGEDSHALSRVALLEATHDDGSDPHDGRGAQERNLHSVGVSQHGLVLDRRAQLRSDRQ
jgi:hypothetical protein